MLLMAKTPKKKDRHLTPGWMIRLPQAYRDQIKASAKRNRRTTTEEAKIAFEEYLKSQGLWPPPNGKESP